MSLWKFSGSSGKTLAFASSCRLLCCRCKDTKTKRKKARAKAVPAPSAEPEEAIKEDNEACQIHRGRR
jgi:hypothetical protein